MNKLIKSNLGQEFSKDMTLEEWAAIGREIYSSAEGLTWQLADWAAFGEREHGALKEFCEKQGMNYGTLKTYAYVASNVEKSNRFDQLTFTHHIEVAPLPSRKQSEWLTKAAKENWSVSELRRQIRGQPEPGDGKPFAFEEKRAIDLLQHLSTRPSEYWTPERKTFWREHLKPIIEFYSTLV